jgi:hypothetical protein
VVYDSFHLTSPEEIVIVAGSFFKNSFISLYSVNSFISIMHIMQHIFWQSQLLFYGCLLVLLLLFYRYVSSESGVRLGLLVY